MLSEFVKPHAFVGEDVEITGMTCDSRAVRAGHMFAAMPGEVTDGRKFIASAIENGASAILLAESQPHMSVPFVTHRNPRRFYSELASRLCAGQPETLVAVTGTNGKSSTVEFLRQIWACAGKQAACLGTLGVRSPSGYRPLDHTTPDAVALHKTLSMLAKQGVTHAAMEASSHGLKQHRMDAVKVTAAGFSNLTRDHFDYHLNMEDYFNAKARLFTELIPAKAPVVINVNDEYGRRLAGICKARGQQVMCIGWCGEHIRINEVMPGAAGQTMDLVVEGKRFKVTLPLVGEYQVLNVVGALGLAQVTGVDLETGLAALEQLTGVAGRLEEAGKTKDGAPIFVDFAHTEDGIGKLLHSVRPHAMGRLVIVFGCGGDRDPDKRAKMGIMAARLADHVIVTDDNPRSEDPAAIRAAVMEGCPDADEIGDRAEAIRAGIAMLKTKDWLVIAGKGHERGQIVGDRIIPFSDVEQVRIALRESVHV
ncbi:MAG: UDP-N-acetylmuramoyl-L-alanyl-D-glutamate--2,6-diaminopimelate ligase [Hyphomonadaceae bacterium]|nr:UDP-N-acetylmuramoyl-L-alanyl-D-glutamate--2,6-diaminopimelate ligase [Hyphomonadaceae bacterium]